MVVGLKRRSIDGEFDGVYGLFKFLTSPIQLGKLSQRLAPEQVDAVSRAH